MNATRRVTYDPRGVAIIRLRDQSEDSTYDPVGTAVLPTAKKDDRTSNKETFHDKVVKQAQQKQIEAGQKAGKGYVGGFGF